MEIIFTYIITISYVFVGVIVWLFYFIYLVAKKKDVSKKIIAKAIGVSSVWPLSGPVLAVIFLKHYIKHLKKDAPRVKKVNQCLFEISKETGLSINTLKKWETKIRRFDSTQTRPISSQKWAAKELAKIEKDIINQSTRYSNSFHISREKIKSLRREIRIASYF